MRRCVRDLSKSAQLVQVRGAAAPDEDLYCRLHGFRRGSRPAQRLQSASVAALLLGDRRSESFESARGGVGGGVLSYELDLAS